MLFFKEREYLPVINTERLMLRAMRVSDADDMYEYACLSDVTHYLLWNPHPSSDYTYKYLKRVRQQYKIGEYYDWAIIYKGSPNDSEKQKRYRGRMIGTCGFASFNDEISSGEIGYVLNPAMWGNGIITEAAREVMKFGFSVLGLNRIEAKYIVGNDRSRRVMEKLGMSYEGTHREYMHIKGINRDIGIYACLRREMYGR